MGIAAENDVRVEKVSKVVPETRSGKKKVVFLTSCDLVCRSYPYINRVFFFKRQAEATAAPPVSLLKEGLGRALVSFYPVAGRFCVDAEGRLQVESGDDEVGAEFVEASCDLPFATLALDGFQYRHLFWNLARRTHYLRSDIAHEPILSVQVTKFRDDGGLSVGVSMSHAVADAQSFYDFVKCWGELCRGLAMSLPPLHMRAALSVRALFPSEFFRESAVPGRVSNGSLKVRCEDSDRKQMLAAWDLKFEDELSTDLTSSTEPQNHAIVVNELVEELENMDIVGEQMAVRSTGPNLNATARTQAPIMEKQLEEEEHRRPRSDLVQKVFSFSVEKLQHLKQRANAAGAKDSGAESVCCNGTEAFSKMRQDISKAGSAHGSHSSTTFESFCAHWWQCFIRAKRLPVNQPVFLLIPINCRQRFLDIPHSYFGNALDGALVKLTAGELCEAELGSVAGRIHEAIKAVTEESFKEYVREAECKRNAIPHFDRRGLFHIVDSPKYPVYDVDFGFGTPEAVRAEGFRFGAEVQILAGRLGAGSFDLFCALDSDTMRRLERDPAFLACTPL